MGGLVPASKSNTASPPGLSRGPNRALLALMRLFYVYILAKHRHGALYVGVTNK